MAGIALPMRAEDPGRVHESGIQACGRLGAFPFEPGVGRRHHQDRLCLDLQRSDRRDRQRCAQCVRTGDLGRKMDGKPVEMIYEDDERKPDVGKQKTEKLIQSDRIDFIVGYNWSNVLLASLKPAVDSKTFLIGINADPSQLAGDLCSPYVFLTSWQNDQAPAAMGLYMNQKDIRSVFLIGPNYAAGKDRLAGFKSTFKGQVLGEEYAIWPTQLDFSAELTKARNSRAESIFVFIPGAAGARLHGPRRHTWESR
jgi:ABC-type branched-subunit amino acid transport system substrate-binding protein